MWLIIPAVCLAALIFRADVQEKPAVEGELLRITTEGVELEGDQGPILVPFAKLTRLSAMPSGKSTREADYPIHVELVDGSLLRGSELTLQNNNVELGRPEAPSSWKFTLKNVHRIRFRSGSVQANAAWDAITRREFTSDALIIRRDAGKLDFLDGILQSITATEVQFRYGDEAMNVNRAKLEGIILANRPGAQAASYQVRTLEEDRIQCAEISMAEGSELAILTPSGDNIRLPLNSFTELTAAQTDRVFVCDLDPDGLEIQPYIRGSELDPGMLKWLYGMRRVSPTLGGKLELRSPQDRRLVSYPHGISLHSYSRAIYRLDSPYRELRGTVGIEAANESTNQAVVRISGGDQVLWEEILRTGEAPKELVILLPSTARLEIVVDFGDDGDFGDRVHFGELRLIK